MWAQERARPKQKTKGLAFKGKPTSIQVIKLTVFSMVFAVHVANAVSVYWTVGAPR
jgi:uncharacterized protein YjdB